MNAEFRWSLAALLFWVSSCGFMIASLITKSATFTYVSGASALLFAVCRWRVRIFEERADPAKARRPTLAAYWVLLLVIFYPLLALALIVLHSIAALIKGESLLGAVGWGALIAALCVLVWGLMEMLGRFARRFVR